MSHQLDRRHFLMAATAVGASAVTCRSETQTGRESGEGARRQSVKIERIDVIPVRYPTVAASKFSKFFVGARGAHGRDAVFVKVIADNGVVGWGQSVPVPRWSYETLETATVVLAEHFAPALIGCDARDQEAAQNALDNALAPAFSTGMPIARAGLDVALHDLWGKLAGKSVAELWGCRPGGSITLSWTVSPRKLDEVDGLIDAGWERGYRNFNIKVSPNPKFDVELARLVRKRVPDGFLWADANGGYDPETALQAAPRLADAGVDVLEAPLKPNRISGYQALKKQGALPILMDEGVVSPVELEEFIRLKMLDGVAMKHSRCGGLVSAKRQIELLTDAGLMWLGSGLSDPDVSLAASLILYAAYRLKKPAALNGPQFLTADVLTNPVTIGNGVAQVPNGPGLGIEVDEEKVKELAKQTTLAWPRAVY